MKKVINIFDLTAGYAASVTFNFGKTIFACTSLEAAESIADRWKKSFDGAIVNVVSFHSIDELKEL
jgi:hypothetical protein